MSVMANRVQSFSHKVSSIIVTCYIGNGKVLADERSACEVVGYVYVVALSIVDSVPCDVDTRGIICQNRYEDSITELYGWVEIPDCEMGYSGKGHIFCFCCRRGNGLLFLREPEYSTTMSHNSITRYRTIGITICSTFRVRECHHSQRN